MKELTAKDFRIGNWVQNNLGTEYQVKAEHILMYHQQGGFFDKPIPLTEEWLIKFGFEERYKSVANKWSLGSFYLHDCENESGKLEGIFYYNFELKIKYVHQLQNLYFALTNEELTITQ